MESEICKHCLSPAFPASPIPFLIAYKAASSISELTPPIPEESTAPALRWPGPHVFPIS